MMRRLMWFCVGLMLGALPVWAFADVQVTGVTGTGSGQPTPEAANQFHIGRALADTDKASVAFWEQKLVWPPSVLSGVVNVTGCGAVTLHAQGADSATFRRNYCDGGGGVRYYATIRLAYGPVQPCPEGTQRDPVTGQCEAPPCEAGETGSSSIQVGWSNVWDVNARPYGVSTPTGGCAGECRITITGLAEQSCYLGDSGSGAPYQVLCWYKTATTGEQCTAGEGQITDRREPIPCPAGTAQGTIGDKTACLPATTSETTTTTNPDGSKTETTTTTNPDGSKTETTTTTDADGNVTGSTTKNYPAPSAPGGSESGGVPGEGGEPQGGEDPLKECVENPDACKEGGGEFGAGAPDNLELFTPNDEATFAGKLSKFRQDMAATELGEAVGGFFTVAGGGTCPTWAATIPFIETTITLDQWCRPEMAGGMAVMKGALLVVFGFLAFRFAIL